MRELRDMSIFEIDITNACNKKCSNCTRFCGHHKKPYFMEFDTFKKAVDSLQDFEGLISIIGGEPTLHPEFARFAEYLQQTGRAKALNDGRSLAIVKDYLGYAQMQRWFGLAYNKGKGYNLFTSIPDKFYYNYEHIQDAFTHMFLNDHTNPSFHQPILISRKDLGIGDEEFAEMRDNCWLQNFWSASITPKGGFFCEVAGTLDILLNGPGGVKIEPGWWKKDISEFKEQFRYCDYCGMALQTFSRNANDEKDDASQSWYKKLKEMDTPGFRTQRVNLYVPEEKKEADGQSIGLDMNSVTANYEPDYEKRVGTAALNLHPHNIYGVLSACTPEKRKTLDELVKKYQRAVDAFYFIAYEEDILDLREAFEDGTVPHRFLAIDKGYENYGRILLKALDDIKGHDWIVMLEDGIELPQDFSSAIKEYYLNPGYIFSCQFGGAGTIMVSKIASAIVKKGWEVIAHCQTEQEVVSLWEDKVCVLDEKYQTLMDIDIDYFRRTIFEEYDKDKEFKNRLKNKLLKSNLRNNKILVMQSAFVFHTLSIVKLLENMGYDVTVLSSRKFKDYFLAWVADEETIYFEEGKFEYENQEDMREKVKQHGDFAGAIVPFFPGASTAKPIDDYTDVFKTANDITGNIIAVINIRRQFVTIEYDY